MWTHQRRHEMPKWPPGNLNVGWSAVLPSTLEAQRFRVPAVIELTTDVKVTTAPRAFLVHTGDAALPEEAREDLERMWNWRPVHDGVVIWLSNGLFGQSLKLRNSNGDLSGTAYPITDVAPIPGVTVERTVPVKLIRIACNERHSTSRTHRAAARSARALPRLVLSASEHGL